MKEKFTELEMKMLKILKIRIYTHTCTHLYTHIYMYMHVLYGQRKEH